MRPALQTPAPYQPKTHKDWKGNYTMISKKTEPKKSERAAELERLLSDMLDYRESASKTYVEAKAKYNDAIDKMRARLKHERESMLKDSRKRELNKISGLEFDMKIAAARVLSIKQSVIYTERSYMAEMLETNADVLAGECARYKRTQEFVKKLAGDYIGCYIGGASDAWPTPYVRMWIEEKPYGSYAQTDLYTSHDSDIIGKNGHIINPSDFQPGPTRGEIEESLSNVKAAVDRANAAKQAYDSALTEVTKLVCNLDSETIANVQGGKL